MFILFIVLTEVLNIILRKDFCMTCSNYHLLNLKMRLFEKEPMSKPKEYLLPWLKENLDNLPLKTVLDISLTFSSIKGAFAHLFFVFV